MDTFIAGDITIFPTAHNGLTGTALRDVSSCGVIAQRGVKFSGVWAGAA